MNPITPVVSLFVLFAVYIFIRMEKIMSAINDLDAVVTSIQADVQSVIALLQSNPDDVAMEAAVAKLQAVDASLKSVLPAPPTPPTT